MEINDILNLFKGKNPKTNKPNSVVSSTLGLLSENDEYKILKQYNTQRATIDINRNLDYVILDLTFGTPFDADMRLIFNALSDFTAEIDKYTSSEEEIPRPVFSITLVSLIDNKYAATFISPIFSALVSLKPGNVPATIRLMFLVDDVQFHEEQPLSDENEADEASDIDEETSNEFEFVEQIELSENDVESDAN